MADGNAPAPRVLAPTRARLDAARAVAAEHDRARELWEAFATNELIPARAVRDEARDFDWTTPCLHGRKQPFHDVCPDCDGTGDYVRYCSHPKGLDHCVAFAADWQGVTQAEALAREAVAWVGAVAPVIVWRVVPRAEALAAACQPSVRHVVAHAAYSLFAAQRELAKGHEITSDVPAARLARDLLATGYALDAISDDAIVLVCPALSP